MHRREMLEACVGALAVAGVSGTAQAIEAETPPLLLIVATEDHLSCHQTECISRAMKPIEDAIEKRTGVRIPIVLLPGGMTIEAVVDPRA